MDLKLNRNQYRILFLIYLVFLVLFAVFAQKFIFHDTWEYILLAKKFAGYLDSTAFTVHSLLYPFLISFFLKVFPSMLTIKLVNTAWIALIAGLLYVSFSKKTAFLLWIFSPIAWMFTVIASPIVPATFFLLAAYLTFVRWRKTTKRVWFALSGLSLGLCAAFLDLGLILVPFFILSFFYDRKLKETLYYIFFVFLSFCLRLILDASLFSLSIKDKIIPFPFYSILRFFGARFVIQMGFHSMIPPSKLHALLSFHFWGVFLVISPLLFLLYKIKWVKFRNVLIFLSATVLLFVFQGAYYFYFILLAPILLIFLSSVFKNKHVMIHIILSILLTSVMVFPYFSEDKFAVKEAKMIIKDLKEIKDDFGFKAAVFDSYDNLALYYLWEKDLFHLVSSQEYKIITNDKYYSHYTFSTMSKFEVQKLLKFEAGLKPNINENINYDSLPLILKKERKPFEGFVLKKCYKVLCVYEK